MKTSIYGKERASARSLFVLGSENRLSPQKKQAPAMRRGLAAKPHKFSFFSASTVFSFRILPVAYSIVANTTANTLPTAMATLYHGI